MVILDRELFEEYAGYGYFESLDEVTEEDLEKKYGESYQLQGFNFFQMIIFTLLL